MKFLYAILAMDIGLLVWADGLPPTPSAENVSTNAPPVVAVDSNAVYQASLRPTPRVLHEDGQIVTWTLEAIEWHIAAPYYKVEWCSDLVEHDWHIIGFRRGMKFSHNRPDGFYRVTRINEPTKPPTHPAQRHPTNTFSLVIHREGNPHLAPSGFGRVE